MTNVLQTNEKKKDALGSLAERLQVDPAILKKTLIATVFKVKGDDNSYRPATDEEFTSLMIVANTYQLNPVTKELYAFPAKGGGIVPIVSTDGWTNLMTRNEKYKSHSYRYSEKMVTPVGGKLCPEWCEIDIERVDGSHVIVREYLDEVFRELPYANPWKTHTKRMLRHKTKIQGARECFGLSGIYDEDEAERIIEIETSKATDTPAQMPKSKSGAVQEIEAPAAVVEETNTEAIEEPTAVEPEKEERPLPAGFNLIKARYNGLCKSKECGKEIKAGTEVAFSKTKGSFHPDCAG